MEFGSGCRCYRLHLKRRLQFPYNTKKYDFFWTWVSCLKGLLGAVRYQLIVLLQNEQKMLERCSCYFFYNSKMVILILTLGVTSKKKQYILRHCPNWRGEVNPISKKRKEIIFWQNLEREGVTKYIVKNRSTHFVWFITQSGPTKGLCVILTVPLTLRK